jgi:CheY-like chemotaxis protein
VAQEGRAPVRIVGVDQGQMMLATRLAAIGQLAAGIAHEINNPVAYSMLNLSFALEQIERLAHQGILVPELRDLIREALGGLDRIRLITRDLRLFSRVERDEQGAADVEEIIRTTCRMIDHEIRQRAGLRLFTMPMPPIRADAAKLGVVLNNLLVNAMQAIEPGAPDRNEIAVSSRLDDGQVVLAVVDTGRGIPEELHQRVFEPFFTTTGSKGTGMGLAQCADIVRRHDGTITLASAVGRGTRVEIRLPFRPVAAERAPTPVPAAPRTGKLRILVVDDDPMVLKAYTRVLGGAFELVLAEGGVAALELVSRDRDFDAVLCDLMMPTIDGVTFFERAAEVIEDLDRRIVFCTGGAFSDKTKEFIAARKVRAVEKPVDAATLRRILEEVAAAAGPPKPDES